MSQKDKLRVLSPIEEVIEDAKLGKMFILIDDENRENEGDLIIPAEFATPESINFMAKFGRGLICLAITGDSARHLGLNLQPKLNSSYDDTAFTTSIEANEGVTTGVSAHDRAKTILVAIDPNKSSKDIRTPGHVFPIIAKDGGVLVRAGHTEASVDISRIAGLNPSAVICEIMNDDGSMARLDHLVEFSKEHDLKIASIASLIEYRRRYEKLIDLSRKFTLSYKGKNFEVLVYKDIISGAEHLAFKLGDISSKGVEMVRVHSHDLFKDSLWFLDDMNSNENFGKSPILEKAFSMIIENGSGVIVIISNTHQFFCDLSSRHADSKSFRNFGIGAQILVDVGVKRINLLSNSPSKMLSALSGYGITIEKYTKII